MGAAGLALGGLQGALALNQANEQAKAYQAQGRYQKAMAETNAMYADLQAKDAIARGDKTAEALKKRGKQVIGEQRASFGAQGIVVDSGSALELQQDTAVLSEIDAMTARNNAWREAWGYRAEAAQASASGQFAQLTARANSGNTLLTGGLQAANYGIGAAASQGYFQRKG